MQPLLLPDYTIISSLPIFKMQIIFMLGTLVFNLPHCMSCLARQQFQQFDEHVVVSPTFILQSKKPPTTANKYYRKQYRLIFSKTSSNYHICLPAISQAPNALADNYIVVMSSSRCKNKHKICLGNQNIIIGNHSIKEIYIWKRSAHLILLC